MKIKRMEVIVSGTVQGVFFRVSTVTQADRIGSITGWVANQEDGSVRVVAEGPEEKLLSLIDWLHEGPEFSRVDNLAVSWAAAAGDLPPFAVRAH